MMSAPCAAAGSRGPGVRTDGVPLDFLSGIHEAPRVEGVLHGGHERCSLGGPPLAAALHDADAVFAGDRAAERDGEHEELLRGRLGAFELVGALGRHEEGGMQVAVPSMPPAAGGKAMAAADGERLVDRFSEAVERDDDVLAHLPAELSADGDRDAVSPTPERFDCGGKVSEDIVVPLD